MKLIYGRVVVVLLNGPDIYNNKRAEGDIMSPPECMKKLAVFRHPVNYHKDGLGSINAFLDAFSRQIPNVFCLTAEILQKKGSVREHYCMAI